MSFVAIATRNRRKARRSQRTETIDRFAKRLRNWKSAQCAAVVIHGYDIPHVKETQRIIDMYSGKPRIKGALA